PDGDWGSPDSTHVGQSLGPLGPGELPPRLSGHLQLRGSSRQERTHTTYIVVTDRCMLRCVCTTGKCPGGGRSARGQARETNHYDRCALSSRNEMGAGGISTKGQVEGRALQLLGGSQGSPWRCGGQPA